MAAVHHPARCFPGLQASAPLVRAHHDASQPFVVDELAGNIRLRVLLLPGFDLWDLAIIEQVAAAIGRQPHGYRLEVGIEGISDDPVLASGGVQVAANPGHLRAPNLLVLGGQVATSDQYMPWWFRLRRAVYESARVFSVAGGTLALAGAGLLDNMVAAAPWQSVAAWHALAPKVRFAPVNWMVGRRVHTCLGGRALAGLLRQCISQQFGVAAASDLTAGPNVAVDMVTTSRLEGWGGLPAHYHPAVHDAIRAMQCNLETPLDNNEICVAAGGVSERTLQRLFRRYLGTTICNCYRTYRLRHARELLRLTPLSITEVALLAGFECPTHFSQCYRREFGAAPRRDRLRD